MNIKFLKGLFAAYEALATKDANTLYFITDTGALYLGEKLIGKDYDASILALQNLIGEVPEGYASLRAYVDSIVTDSGYVTVSVMEAAIKEEADRAKGIEEGLRTDVDAIKADYLTSADITNFETKENVKKVADDLAAYIEANDAALAEVDGKVGENTTAIEGLDGRVGVAEGEIDALQEQIKGLSGAMHFVGTYDELPTGVNPIKVGDALKDGDLVYVDTVKAAEFIDTFLAKNPEFGSEEYTNAVLIRVTNGSGKTPAVNILKEEDGVIRLRFDNGNVIYSTDTSETITYPVTWNFWTNVTVTEVEEGVDFVYINGEPGGETFVSGDVIAVGDKEYVFNGTEFVEFGDISAEGERLTALEDKVGEKTVATQISEAIAAENLGQYAKTADIEDDIAKGVEAKDAIDNAETGLAAAHTKAQKGIDDAAAALAAANSKTTLAAVKEAYIGNTEVKLDAVVAAVNKLYDGSEGVNNEIKAMDQNVKALEGALTWGEIK